MPVAKYLSSKANRRKLMPIERILTVSAADYCSSTGRNLRDYRLIGVVVETQNSEDFLINNFARVVPQDAEVVVGFRHSYGGTGWGYAPSRVVDTLTKLHAIASGTALIRRKKKTKKSRHQPLPS